VFIIDYFTGPILSPRRGDSGLAFMGSTHNGTPSPWWATVKDSIKEFLTVSIKEVGFGLPSTWRHGTGALPAAMTTTPWTENALPAQAMTMVSLQMEAPWPDTSIPFEQRCTR
jgi:hypothetical protein